MIELKDGKEISHWADHLVKEQLENEPNERMKYIIAGLFGTGARVGEFVLLKKKDIDYADQTTKNILLTTVKTFKNRNHHERILPLHTNSEGWFVSIIIDWANKQTNPEGYLLPGKKPGTHLTKRRVEQLLRKRYNIHPHLLRHSRSTYNYNIRKFTDAQNMFFMGWSDLQPAHIYTHFKWSDLV